MRVCDIKFSIGKNFREEFIERIKLNSIGIRLPKVNGKRGEYLLFR